MIKDYWQSKIKETKYNNKESYVLKSTSDVQVKGMSVNMFCRKKKRCGTKTKIEISKENSNQIGF